MNVVRRIAPACAVALAASVAVVSSAVADPPPTQVVTVIAVGPGGEAINGYTVAPGPGNVGQAGDCSQVSPSALADNVYYCSPSAAGAGTCWPSTPGSSLLCVDNPWDRQMHRVMFDGPLPTVHPSANPDPFALTLDDGTRCLLRNGGAWGGRADGYVGVYGCGGAGSDLAVLWQPSQGAGSCIDRSSPVWTVKVGRLGAPDAVLPPPATRVVTSAWLAGGRAGQ